jgi:hypothetical protein
MMKALEQDIDDHLQIAKERSKEAAVAAKPLSFGSVKTRVPHAVLVAMGEEGRLRAMWEYYNVWCDTRPGFGKPAILTYKEGSMSRFFSRRLRSISHPNRKQAASL